MASASSEPLVLKDVADDIGMHESTISRATANKYAHTPQGIFELKFFFTSGVKAADGEDVSAETVKERIRAMVGGEDATDPLSDQAIAEVAARREDQYRAPHRREVPAGARDPALRQPQAARLIFGGRIRDDEEPRGGKRSRASAREQRRASAAVPQAQANVAVTFRHVEPTEAIKVYGRAQARACGQVSETRLRHSSDPHG